MQELLYTPLDIAIIVYSMELGCRAESAMIDSIWTGETAFLPSKYRNNQWRFGSRTVCERLFRVRPVFQEYSHPHSLQFRKTLRKNEITHIASGVWLSKAVKTTAGTYQSVPVVLSFRNRIARRNPLPY